MAHFIEEYDIDTRSLLEKIFMGVAWLGLFLLIPGTALGYFAEQTYPGQTLYPMKQGIEQMVLFVESITPTSRSNYLQVLAGKRIQETKDIITHTPTDAPTLASQSLDSAVQSIEQAQLAITYIQDPAAKQQASEQLATSIRTYKVQLTQLHYQVQQDLIYNLSPTPSSAGSNLPTPTTTVASPTTATTSDLTSLNTQITTTVQQLDQINSSLSASVSQPAPIAPSATPTLVPTATSTSIPSTSSGSTTPTPTPRDHKGNTND